MTAAAIGSIQAVVSRPPTYRLANAQPRPADGLAGVTTAAVAGVGRGRDRAAPSVLVEAAVPPTPVADPGTTQARLTSDQYACTRTPSRTSLHSQTSPISDHAP